MQFTSLKFMAFFAAVLVISYSLKPRAKEIFLTFASYVFYATFDWRCAFLLIAITVTTYFCAVKGKYKIGIIFSLLVLCFFKYYNFFLGDITGTLKIVLPVGISFYTFTSVSYIADCQREKIEAENDFIKVALYLSFFPTVLSGPIMRSNVFLPQLYEERKVTKSNVLEGIQIFAFGLFKKIVLADHLSVFVNDVYASPSTFSFISIALAAVSYSMEIYFDFSGYSDMATGCAKCLGYDLPKNFNLPYISRNVTEFWRRWHISLSTWMRDYIYIPLGGNRKGKAMTYLNLFLTMAIGGLWHGADWTFVIWGALNGAALCFDKKIKLKSSVLTFLFITFTWIFFRADTFKNAFEIITGMVTLQKGVVQVFSWTIISAILLVLATISAISKNKEKADGYYPIQDLSTVKGMTVFFVFIGLTVCLAFTGEQPFVYLQF